MIEDVMNILMFVASFSNTILRKDISAVPFNVSSACDDEPELLGTVERLSAYGRVGNRGIYAGTVDFLSARDE